MKVFLFFAILFAFYCEAYDPSRSSQNSASWIKTCQGDRIYLNPHNLILSDDGIFLIDETNQKIALPLLCSDAQGIYTLSRMLEFDSVVAYPVWCRTCKAWRVIGLGGLCNVCGNNP